jgi:UDP:flavonoid glycosyltransferase YjiC (YdhE family)
MRVLLVPFGSHGDVHPFVGLALALRERGHRVTFVLNEYFGPLVRGLGFEMLPVGDLRMFEDALRDPDFFDPKRGFAAVARWVIEHAREAYPRVAEWYVPGESVAVGGSMAFAVRLAQETLGVPAATVHLQPMVFHTLHETPAYSGGFAVPRWWPRWLKRVLFDQAYARFIDPHIVPGLNAQRAGLGLPPVRDPMRVWLHEAPLVLGFFPSWFGPPQPDWPPRLQLVGFPLYDERDASPMSPELAAFLADGPPPVAFTPGSANLYGRPFFEAAVDACTRLGRRGVLLTRFPEQVPPGLPASVRHFAYAPFSQLLPRAAALVHHGGIGTAAQGMSAGVPQLIMPLAHDQYDNVARMRRLGIARALPPAKFRGPAVARALGTLLDSPEVAARCRAVADRFADDPRPMERASEAIEALARAAAVPAGTA